MVLKILFILLAVGIVLIDHILKFLVMTNSYSLVGKYIIKGFIQITYIQNKGAAFGILKGHKEFFILITIFILLFIIYIVFSGKIQNKIFIISASLVVGGGIGNLIDRITRGYVIDYFEFSFFPLVCNISDYCISIGAFLLIIYAIFIHDTKALENGK